jgi:cellulose synthase (UDP-forming)
MRIPASLRFSTGRTLVCETVDYAEGGVALQLPAAIQVPLHESVVVSLFRGQEEFVFPADVTYSVPGRVGLKFAPMTREQELDFVQSTFARADAWTGWAEGREVDTPLRSLSHVMRVGLGGIGGLFEHLYADLRTWSGRRKTAANDTKNGK